MTVPMIPLLCEICIHNRGFKPGLLKIYCDAFPNGVPDEILMEKIKHVDPIDGDNGIVFEPRVRDDVKLNQIAQEVFEQTLKLNYKCKAGTVDDSNKCGDVADKASFRGLSKEDTKLVIDSIREAKEKYGLEKLSFLGTKKVGKNVVGSHGKITKTFFGMEMPDDEYDITIDKNLLKNLKSGYNAVPSLKGVVNHEIGHFIMETIHKNIPTGEIQEIKYKSGKIGRIERTKSLVSVIESAYDRMSKDDIEKFIGTYAKKDYKEFGAEVYSKAVNEGWGFIENMPNREDMLNIKDCFEKSELKNYREPIFDVPPAPMPAPMPIPKPKPKKSEQVGLDAFKLMSGIVQDVFDETIKLNYKCKKGTKDPNTNECSTDDSSNWSDRTHDKVVDNPFIEGAPSKEKVKSIKEFIDKSKDKYNPTYIKFYHGTDPSIDIENEGLLPTSNNRRRSFQSTSGYVYLANTPERARVFGEMGNQGKAVVYEVVVPGHAILADKDQLNNQRAAGINVGDSVAESIVYGGGVRVKGKIDPWQIKKYSISGDITNSKGISIDNAVKAVKSMKIDLDDKETWRSTRDKILEELAKQNGFNGRSQIVTKDYFKKKSEEGTVLYRGIQGNKSIEHISEGEYYAGKGISGNGIYASDVKSFAKRYAGKNGTLVTMLLPNDSNVIDIQELFKVRRQFLDDNKNHEDIDLLSKIVKDAGRFAVVMGYDAVKIPDTSEMIILNRSKLLIRG